MAYGFVKKADENSKNYNISLKQVNKFLTYLDFLKLCNKFES